jgi:hypothetical protein
VVTPSGCEFSPATPRRALETPRLSDRGTHNPEPAALFSVPGNAIHPRSREHVGLLFSRQQLTHILTAPGQEKPPLRGLSGHPPVARERAAPTTQANAFAAERDDHSNVVEFPWRGERWIVSQAS